MSDQTATPSGGDDPTIAMSYARETVQEILKDVGHTGTPKAMAWAVFRNGETGRMPQAFFGTAFEAHLLREILIRLVASKTLNPITFVETLVAVAGEIGEEDPMGLGPQMPHPRGRGLHHGRVPGSGLS